MHRALRLHPDCHRNAAGRVEVDVSTPEPGRLVLTYVLTGRMADVALPPPAEAVHTDDLWQHTCFELFLHPPGASGYYEFNFSPSGGWAAYQFDGYRLNRRPLPVTAPAIKLAHDGSHLTLTAGLDLPFLSNAPLWTLALTAVVEESGGAVTYWALNHPPGKADFHHADGFALELPL